MALVTRRWRGRLAASMSVYGVMRSLLVRLRPEWESQPYAKGDEKRTDANTIRGTLTDEERAALHWFAHYGLPENRAATLRSLLSRLS